MRATGVVRRIDELGRIVIPKEIRRTMRMREGDSLEIFVEHNDEIVLKKYSMIAQLATFTQSYADNLYKTSGLSCAISDKDRIVAFAGQGKKDILYPSITAEIEDIMKSRLSYFKQFPSEINVYAYAGATQPVIGVTPIVNGGDCAGAIMLLADEGQVISDTQKRLLVLTARLIAARLDS